MTTRVTIKNENQGTPYADWSIEVTNTAKVPTVVLKPGESVTETMWHGSALTIREVPKGP